MNEGANLMVRKAVNKSLSKDEIDNIEKEIACLYEKENKIRLDFLKQNPSSIAALWLVEDMIIRSQIEMDEVIKYLEKVDEKYYNNSYYKALKTRVEGYLKTKAGNVVDFKTSQTIDGNVFDIKSLRGKYVIMDFWGTWCGAC